MSLRGEYPTRFGWRYWRLERDRLAAPYWGAILGRTRLLDAQCRHGNVPPSSACPCGVHYVPDVDRFVAEMQSHPPASYPVSYGVAVGPVLDDLYAATWPGSFGVVRARRYLVLAIAVPQKYISVAQRLREFYRVDVVPEISLVACRGVAAAVDAALQGCGVEFLDEIDCLPRTPQP